MSANLCCGGFQSTCIEVEITKGPQVRPLDGCGDRAAYYIAADADCSALMPVKLGAEPGMVEPAPDGVGAIGFIVAAGDPQEGTDVRCITIQRTGHLCWADLAPVVGSTVADKAAWWAIHAELAKPNIYVEL